MSDQDQGPLANIADAHEMGCTRRDPRAEVMEIRVSAAEYIRAQMWAAIVGVSLDASELSLVRQRIEDASERIAAHIAQANFKARSAERRADEDAQQHRATVESLREAMSKQSTVIYDLRLEVKDLQATCTLQSLHAQDHKRHLRELEAERDAQARLIANLKGIKHFLGQDTAEPAQEPTSAQEPAQEQQPKTDKAPDADHLAQRMDALCRQLGEMMTKQQATLERVEQLEGRLNAKK